jgi:hypothetical protein
MSADQRSPASADIEAILPLTKLCLVRFARSDWEKSCGNAALDVRVQIRAGEYSRGRAIYCEVIWMRLKGKVSCC